jgi:hypothetical protein
VITPDWVLVSFIVFGFAYYIGCEALMHSLLFAPMRYRIKSLSTTSKFFLFLRNMLNCMQCTAIEVVFWTLGIIALTLGMCYHLPEKVVTALVLQPAHLPWLVEFVFMFLAAFAMSLAVAAEAWAIKVMVESTNEKFLVLKAQFQKRETALLERIRALETKPRGCTNVFEPGEVVIPKGQFVKIFSGLLAENFCNASCPYARTACQLQRLLTSCGVWFYETNGSDAPGFVHYEQIFAEATREKQADTLYRSLFEWNTWGVNDRVESEVATDLWNELIPRVRHSFSSPS